MGTVVIHPSATLPDRQAEYCRTSADALETLARLRSSSEGIDTLWVHWDLGNGDDSAPVIEALAREARAGRAFAIGRIILHTHNNERLNQMMGPLTPWYDVDAISPSMSVLGDSVPAVPQDTSGLTLHQRLRRAGVRIDPGLGDNEVETIQARHGFVFSPTHREFLQSGLPVDTVPTRRGWPHWRHGDLDELAARIERPRLHLVENGSAAGPIPVLLPLFGNQFLPSAEHLRPSPVLSAHEIDVIYHAPTLEEWIARTFEGIPWTHQRPAPEDRIPYWSDLAERI
ncbi:hypothetical protein [Nocardioides houyundeii]|uniref:hypothetical protein n=1 Tax=Nocardioides houyundeii TaxID=2045452 RepID=UPI000C77F36D|nr:hypothetical protein [Nocardioides houyundeii]